ncbi:uncharacterized protein LOC128884449 [Hylaeus volcanicus]|uniref:uncharacterized protein LOC128884449 n=1 Tax=Hylaeus volcanicus TaxID=313075 RepID=UPI0023B82064|nr:uncharacterized protein LOC128884449 [Hylaeus volcanicus]
MMRYMSESKPKELIPRPLKIISKKDLLAARAKCLTEKNTPMQLQIVDVENRNKISNKQSIDSETKIQDFPKTKTDSDKQAPSHFNKSLLTTSCETLELLKLSDRYTKTIGSTRFNDSHKNTLKPTVEGSSARKRVGLESILTTVRLCFISSFFFKKKVDKGQDKLNWCSTDIKEKPLKKSVLRYRLRQIAIGR